MAKMNPKSLPLKEKVKQALIPESEQPYEVPENWRWVFIGNITEVVGGGTPSSTNTAFYENGDIPWISPADLSGYSDIYISCGAKYITKLGLEKSSARLLPKDSVCLSTRAPIGYVVIAKNPLATNQGFKSFLPSSLYLPHYLYWYLKANKEMLESMASGTTFLELSGSKAATIKFPIAPLTEQQRIVDRIESLFAKLDEAKEKAQAVVDGYEDRKAAILHKAFTGELTKKWRDNNRVDPLSLLYSIRQKKKNRKQRNRKVEGRNDASLLDIRIPSSWVAVDLDTIACLITDGEHQTPRRVKEFCGYYLLSARNIHNDELVLSDVDYIDEAEYSRISQRCNPKKGNILLSCSGSVGRCCVVDDDNKYCMVRSAAMIAQEGCNARYIMYAIQSDQVQDQIRSLSKQTAQANLFLGAIASLIIPITSINEQETIVDILDTALAKMQEQKRRAELAISQIDSMKKAILSRAFRGELGTNDPSEEPVDIGTL